MSRSGYAENGEADSWRIICWRGAVKKAITGKRGQALLVELRDALDAMAVKELAAGVFQAGNGCLCALGVLGAKRGINLREMDGAADEYEFEKIGKAFGVSQALVRRIMFMNDEGNWFMYETPAERWTRMRKWIENNIHSEPSHA